MSQKKKEIKKDMTKKFVRISAYKLGKILKILE